MLAMYGMRPSSLVIRSALRATVSGSIGGNGMRSCSVAGAKMEDVVGTREQLARFVDDANTGVHDFAAPSQHLGFPEDILSEGACYVADIASEGPDP